MFRQQAFSLESTDFGKINQSLYPVTFLAHQTSRGKACSLCLGDDRMATECALNPSRALPTVRLQRPEREQRSEQRSERDLGNRDARARRGLGACFSWNDGRCIHLNCRYRHVCSKCSGDHKRGQCAGAGEKGYRQRETEHGHESRPGSRN